MKSVLLRCALVLGVLAVLGGPLGPSGAAPTPAGPAPAATTPSEPAAAPTPPAPGRQPVRWTPAPGTTWQWQLRGRIDTTVPAAVYDVDGFDTPAAVVDRLHAQGRRVVCYLSAGSFEQWRPDAAAFPDAVKGRPLDGWAGERWLDVRRLDVLRPIMAARMDRCAAKGFDAVEPDNVDGWANRTGFPLTAASQLRYNRLLARLAHERGMAVGLKNDVDQVRALEPYFDFAVNEECAAYDECAAYAPFVRAGKAVLHVEYDLERRQFCRAAARQGLSSMRKRLQLDAWRRPCPR